MSEMKLSPKMLEDVQAAISAHDPAASDDVITVQYLAALQGMMLAQMAMPQAQREDIASQLADFTRHVLQEMSRPPAPPPQQEAFGIWKPGKS
ncbi:MAG: hypothetical protein LPK58_03320 [Gammaproteobacteria bacterium]|nr:hypothetical protein [Chromatiales bacterium]MDX5333057.1 hypothetical protein [Gammaproteobacteria bacterium]MDX5374711.1 hypothetical protein [Gammaproteobacteria bacterium]